MIPVRLQNGKTAKGGRRLNTLAHGCMWRRDWSQACGYNAIATAKSNHDIALQQTQLPICAPLPLNLESLLLRGEMDTSSAYDLNGLFYID